MGALAFVKRNYQWIAGVSGVVMIAIGVLVATNLWTRMLGPSSARSTISARRSEVRRTRSWLPPSRPCVRGPGERCYSAPGLGARLRSRGGIPERCAGERSWSWAWWPWLSWPRPVRRTPPNRRWSPRVRTRRSPSTCSSRCSGSRSRSSSSSRACWSCSSSGTGTGGTTPRIPAQVHGNTRLEIAWTILPTLILAGVAVPTIATIWDLAARPTGDVLEVNVLGHQWWWEFDYPGQQILTANELHIPTGRPVYLTLCAVGFGYGAPVPSQGGPPAPNACQTGPPDGQPPAGIGAAVIHLLGAGARGHRGRRAGHDEPPDDPGRRARHLRGAVQGVLRPVARVHEVPVVAHTPEDFDRWVAEQQAPASPDVSGPAEAGNRSSCRPASPATRSPGSRPRTASPCSPTAGRT